MVHSSGHGFVLLGLTVLALWSLMLIRTPGQESLSFSSLQTRAEQQNKQNSSSSLAAKVPVISNSSLSNATSSSNSSTVSSNSTTSTSFTTSSRTTTITTTSDIDGPLLTTNTTSSPASTTISTSTSLNTSTSSSSSEASSAHVPVKTTAATTTTSASTTSTSTFFSIPSSSSDSSSFISTPDSQTVSQTPIPSLPIQNVAAASNGFWSNKSAVAGTFSVVALIIVGLLAGLFTFLMKRNNRYKDEYREYERELGPSPQNPPSPGLSTSELHHTPMDPFADPAYYNVGITNGPPAATYSDTHLPPSFTSLTPSHDDLYDPFSTPAPQIVPPSTLTSVTTLTPGHPYASARGKLAPVNFKESVHRDSYQPSIDSFYGAADSSGQAGTAH